MKFSLIIPNITKKKDKLKLLKECLMSFRVHNGFDHEVIVVDDCSNEEFRESIKDFCLANDARFIQKDKNEGFATTVNIGIRAASGDVVVLCNNDLKFTTSIFEALKENFESDSKLGIIGGLLYYPTGKIQHGGIIRHGYAFTHAGWHKEFKNAPEVQAQKYMIGVTGALFAIRRECFQGIGLLDESYFLASEDTQYCLRAWLGGWKVMYDPRVTAIHVEGGTRGAATQEKLSASIDTRAWYLKELATAEKFNNYLKTINLVEIDRRVAEANLIAINIKIDKMSKPLVKEKPNITLDKIKESGQQVIGIHRAGAFGDVLMVTPVVRELKKKFPNAHIVFSTLSPEVFTNNSDVSYVTKDKHEALKVSKVFYDLDNVYERSPKVHAVQAYAKAILGEEISDISMSMNSSLNDFNYVRSLIPEVKFGLDKIVVMHMGVGWANRTWAKEHWMALARMFSTRNIKVIVVGKGGDYHADAMAGVVNVNNKLNVFQVRELIKYSNCFVGMDSGMMHVAQTTETPVVGLFTIANPEYRVTRPAKFSAVVPRVECKFCLHEQPPPVNFVACKFNTNQCLKDITPVQVYSEIIKYF